MCVLECVLAGVVRVYVGWAGLGWVGVVEWSELGWVGLGGDYYNYKLYILISLVPLAR